MAEQDGKRVIEQQATSEVFADDWFLKDSVTEGTTKISSENLKAFINEDIDLSAEAISYDNTSSGLEADNVQDAIDEVLETAGKVDDVKVDGESVVDENKVANIDLSALKIVRDIPNTPTAIATFSDGSNLPMPKLEVGIEAVQDLHGYDHPWVGGAGKNKLPMTVNGIKSANGGASSWTGNSKVINNVTFTIQTDSDGNVTGIGLNGTANGTTDLVINSQNGFAVSSGTYTYSAQGINNTCRFIVGSGAIPYTELGASGIGNSVNFTTEGGNSGFCILRVASGANINTTFKPQLEVGSTATTFEPYSNICPIIGWDEVNVGVSGVNVWDEEWEVGNINDGSGEDLPQDNVIRSKGYIRVMSGASYYIKCPTTGISRLFLYAKDKSFITYVPIDNITNNIYTIPNNCAFIRFRTLAAYGTTYNNDISINYPSTDTEYHAYNGTTYNIQFTDAQGNPIEVFGGECDVVNGTSGNVSAKGYMEITKDTPIDYVRVASNGNATFYFHVSNIDSENTNSNCESNALASYDGTSFYNYPPQFSVAFSNHSSGETTKSVCISTDTNITTEADFKTWIEQIGTIQVLYRYATPSTFVSQPTPIKSLEGTNNVWGDCGDVRDGKYIANASSTIASLDARITALENQ